MTMFLLTVAAAIVQAVALAAFAAVAKAAWEPGKPLIITLTILAMAYLSWRGATRLKAPQALLVLPGGFTVAYLVAFHVTGVLAFPGLLRAASLSADYLGVLLRVGAVVFAAYVAACLLFYALRIWLERRGSRSN